MKKIPVIIASAVTALTILTCTAPTANAAFYRGSFSRGVKNVCYCKTSFEWSTDSRYLINSSSGWQYASGMFAQEGGTYCIEANGITETWAALTNELFGVNVKGVSLGLKFVYEDHAELCNGGGINVEWDV